MATLADELLADLMSDGSDADDNEFVDEEEQYRANGGDAELDDHNGNEHEANGNDHMSMDGIISAAAGGSSAVADAEDQDEAEALVKTMHNLRGINDIRSVSGLMKSLKPVIEVSYPVLLS
jgi:U4/U6 small nuclear ribonucleoprotein PRP31